MSAFIDSVAIMSNALFTIACGGIIAYLVSISKLKRHIFYYGWSIGFILYGLQILFRGLFLSQFIITVPMIIAFIVLPSSTFMLSPQRKNLLYLSFLIFLYAFLICMYFLGIIREGDFFLPGLLGARYIIFLYCLSWFLIEPFLVTVWISS